MFEPLQSDLEALEAMVVRGQALGIPDEMLGEALSAATLKWTYHMGKSAKMLLGAMDIIRCVPATT